MFQLNFPAMENNNNANKAPLVTVRYAGDYSSHQLFGRYAGLDAAQAAVREGKKVAIENGNAKLAQSIKVYAN